MLTDERCPKCDAKIEAVERLFEDARSDVKWCAGCEKSWCGEMHYGPTREAAIAAVKAGGNSDAKA